MRLKDTGEVFAMKSLIKDAMIKAGLRRPKPDEAVRAAEKSEDEVLRV